MLQNVNEIITGPYIQAQRDTTLLMRGSSNQKIFIFDSKNNLWYNKENQNERYKNVRL